MGRPEKITWDKIYRDFRKKCSGLAQRTIYWMPRGYLEITLFLDDGSKMRYNFFDKIAKFTNERWK